MLAQFRQQVAESEERARWAQRLNVELEDRAARVQQLQQELVAAEAAARAVAVGYEVKVRELDEANIEKTHWALETEARVGKEIDEKGRELAECVEFLHQAERTIEERTAWAEKLKREAYLLEKQVILMKESRWVKLGRAFGLGPDLRNS